MMGTFASPLKVAVGLLLASASLVAAHDHHGDPETLDPSIPIDAVLWAHIAVQALVWCILWPIGIVLGLSRSRWHVPLQSTGFVLTTAGYILGHSHKGRSFPVSFHSKVASFIIVPMAIQLCFGIYLKLHIQEKTWRPYAAVVHRWVARAFPFIGTTQALLGVLVLLGVCFPEGPEKMHPEGSRPLIECLQTIATSLGLLSYGVINFILLESKGSRKPEWIDSLNIFFGGAAMLTAGLLYSEVNQASLGLFWTLGGALGVLVSRGQTRNIIPGAIIMITGAVSSLRSHPGAEALSAIRHLEVAFSVALGLAGLARIIEICFTLPLLSESSPLKNPWQHATPFLMILSGMLYPTAHTEQATFLTKLGLQSGSVIFLCISLTLVVYGFLIYLAHLYATTGRNAAPKPESYAMIPEERSHPPRPIDLRRVPDEKILFTITSADDSDFEDEDLNRSR